jgi:cytochrome c oxidase assembly protein subunit 15
MRGHTLFRALAVASALACYVTILVGGNVIATGSGLGCPNWPNCQGTLWPSSLSGPAAIEFSHRASAFALSLLVLGTVLSGLAFERRRPVLLRLGYSSLAVVVLEAILGGIVVQSALLGLFVIIHLAIATVLLGLLSLLAVLANYPHLPPGWRRWARRAAGEAPPVEPLPSDRAVPAAPVGAQPAGPGGPGP